MEELSFDTLLGKSFEKVVNTDSGIEFTEVGGQVYVLEHQQECCEDVYLESVVGDLQDLVHTPITVAEEIDSSGLPDDLDPGPSPEDADTSLYHTWTFYKLATRKGFVDLRWYGSSNGYYSEKACLYKAEMEEIS